MTSVCDRNVSWIQAKVHIWTSELPLSHSGDYIGTYTYLPICMCIYSQRQKTSDQINTKWDKCGLSFLLWFSPPQCKHNGRLPQLANSRDTALNWQPLKFCSGWSDIELVWNCRFLGKGITECLYSATFCTDTYKCMLMAHVEKCVPKTVS